MASDLDSVVQSVLPLDASVPAQAALLRAVRRKLDTYASRAGGPPASPDDVRLLVSYFLNMLPRAHAVRNFDMAHVPDPVPHGDVFCLSTRRRWAPSARSAEALAAVNGSMALRTRVYSALHSLMGLPGAWGRLRDATRIGSPSAYGSVHIVCLTQTSRCFTVSKLLRGAGALPPGSLAPYHMAMKVQVSRADGPKFHRKFFDNEVYFLRLATRTVKAGLCVNFPIMYAERDVPCDTRFAKSLFRVPPLCDSARTHFILAELATTDMQGWIAKSNPGKRAIQGLVLQTLMALTVTSHAWRMFHSDVHPGNVLLNKLSAPTDLVYEIPHLGLTVVLERQEYVGKLWDFAFGDVWGTKAGLRDGDEMLGTTAALSQAAEDAVEDVRAALGLRGDGDVAQRTYWELWDAARAIPGMRVIRRCPALARDLPASRPRIVSTIDMGLPVVGKLKWETLTRFGVVPVVPEPKPPEDKPLTS